MKLQPRPANRLANAGPGVISLVIGVAAVIDRDALTAALGVVLAVGGVVLAPRGYWLSVETCSDAAVVHGLLWSRRVSRRSIVEVTDYPALIWADSSGKRRWTPVHAFQTPARTLPGVRQHHASCITTLRRWALQR